MTQAERIVRTEKIWYKQSSEKQQSVLLYIELAVQKKVKVYIEFMYDGLQIDYSTKNSINDLFNKFDFDIKIYYERIGSLELNRNSRQRNILVNIIFR